MKYCSSLKVQVQQKARTLEPEEYFIDKEPYYDAVVYVPNSKVSDSLLPLCEALETLIDRYVILSLDWPHQKTL